MCACAGVLWPLTLLVMAAVGSSARAASMHRTLTAQRGVHEDHPLSKAVTVVINFNQHNPVNLEVVHVLHTAYSAAFHRVVFTGQARPDGLEAAISWAACEFEWTFFSLCLAYTMAEFPEAPEGGYIFVGDDSVRPSDLPAWTTQGWRQSQWCCAAACMAARDGLALLQYSFTQAQCRASNVWHATRADHGSLPHGLAQPEQVLDAAAAACAQQAGGQGHLCLV